MTITTDSAPNTAVRDIPISDIEPSDFNPRRVFDPDRLDELAESIRQHGLIEPVVVRPHPENWQAKDGAPIFELIAGERRWRAAQQAGLETIPAMVRDVDDATAIQLAVVENLQRADLDPIEEAAGFQLLLERAGMTQRDAAAALNRSQPAIANALRLLRLPEKVQAMIREGKLSRAHGVALMRWDGFPEVQHELAKVAVRRAMSSKDLEKGLKDWQVREALVKSNAVRDVGFRTTFDTAVCESCPFNAYRKADYTHLCLNPEHYDELEAVAVEERKQAIDAAAEQAAAGGEKASVRDLEFSTFRELESACDPDIDWVKLADGCSEDCPCRRQMLNYHGDKLIPVCLDPGRYEELKQQAEKAEAKRKKQALQDRTAQLEQLIDRVPELGTVPPEELAMLAGKALTRVSRTKLLLEVAERQGIADQLDLDGVERWTYQNDPGRLASTLSSLQILRFAVEVMLREELMDRYMGSYPSEAPLADFYLGPDESEAE